MWWYWTQSSLRAYLDSAAWISKAKKPSRGVCRTQPQKRDVWQRSASKRKMSYNLLCLWFWIRFIAVPFFTSELVKRRIQVLFAQQRSCLAPNTTQLANGLRICPARAKWNWNHYSHILVNADNCSASVSEKIPSPTRHRSVRTSTALIVIWIVLPCLLPLCMSVTLHTLSNFVIISLFFKKVSRVAVVNMFCRICIFVAWKVRSGVTLFVIARPEEDANTPEQSRSQVETALPGAMGHGAPSEPVPHSHGFVVTSEHAVISAWSAGSSSPVQSIPRVDGVETHGFGGVESVTSVTYISMPSKPVFLSSGLAVTRCVDRAVSHGFDVELKRDWTVVQRSPHVLRLHSA